MSIDLYSKAVLALIGFSLLWIGAQLTRGTANAQSVSLSRTVTIDNSLLKVNVCHDESARCADVAFFGKVEIDRD